MLNETRKQVRELRGPSRQHSAIQAYRYVYTKFILCNLIYITILKHFILDQF